MYIQHAVFHNLVIHNLWNLVSWIFQCWMSEYEKNQIAIHTTWELMYRTMDDILGLVHPGGIIETCSTDFHTFSKLCLYIGRLHVRNI